MVRYYFTILLAAIVVVMLGVGFISAKDIKECEKKHSTEVCYATLNP